MSKEITLVVTEKEHELFEGMVRARIDELNRAIVKAENEGEKVLMHALGTVLDVCYGMEYLLYEAKEEKEL